MKHCAYIFFFVISFLLVLGCRTDNSQNSTVNESTVEVESQSETIKEVSNEAFSKTKEIEPLEMTSMEQTPTKENSTEGAAEKLSKTDKSKKVVRKKDAQKPVKKRESLKRLRPKITFDSIVHHLPTITRGEIFAHEFKFKNTGDAPLSILLAVPSCGCTLPSYPFLDILPDSSGVIQLEYNSVGKHGKQEADITITANTRPKETILTMVFDVEEPEEERKTKKDTLSN